MHLFLSFLGDGPASRLGRHAHKCILLNNMTPNMTTWPNTKLPELN
jgi:hypothetical protein